MDPLYWITPYLLPLNGTNGSQVITDYSYFPKGVTVAGNAMISTAQSAFGGASLYLDGVGDYLSTNGVVSSNGFVMTGDLTIEFWARCDDFSQQRTMLGSMMSGIAGPQIYFNTSGNLVYEHAGSVVFTTATVYSTLTWYHVALTVVGSLQRVFVNGVLVGSGSPAGFPAVLNWIHIGAAFGALDTTATKKFKGYIDDFRLTNGAARYIANFTPPGALDTTHGPVVGIALKATVRLATSASGANYLKYRKAFTKALVRDLQSGGFGRITGTVKEAGTPADLAVVRRVRLYRKLDGGYVKEVWSTPDGSYTFDYLDMNLKFFVTSFDHTGNYNAVIKDTITPEVMP